MHSRIKNKKVDLFQKWKNYNTNLATYTKLANEKIVAHTVLVTTNRNPPLDADTILTIKKLLEKIPKIETDLKFYEKKAKEHVQDISSPIIKNMLAEISLENKKVLSMSIQLNKILADIYMYTVRTVKSIDKKKEYIKNAYESIQHAWKLKQDNSTLLPVNYDPELRGCTEHIARKFSYYFPDNATNDTIQNILFFAKQIKDKDEEFNKYQEALDLAKKENNLEQQFFILWEQGASYTQKVFQSPQQPTSIQDLEFNHKMVRKICDAYISAAEIKLTLDNEKVPANMMTNCEGICSDFYNIANYLLILSSSRYLANDLDRKLTILKDAKTYQEWSDRLSNNINKKFLIFQHLDENITAAITDVDCKKIKIKQDKLDKEQEKLHLENCMQEYNQKFDEILKSFEEEETHKSTENNHSFQRENTNVDIQPTGLADEPVEEFPDVDVAFERQDSYFDLNRDVAFLHQAELANDSQQQIYLNTNIAEYYRNQALNLLKKGRPGLWNSIDNLEQAKHYLSKATKIIDEIKNGNRQERYTQFIQLEECILIVSEHTETLLMKTIKQQQKLKERLDKSREEAKNYIINKYGRSAWFRNNTFDCDLLSHNARIRLMTTDNLSKLESIEADMQQILSRLKNNKYQKKLNTNDYNNLNNIYNQHSFFNAKLQSQRHRSQSFSSFFDPNEVLARDVKRKAYGR